MNVSKLSITKEQKEKAWRKRKKKLKQNLKTHSDYQHDLQVEINKISRLIDFGNNCMMCKGKLNGKSFGCHYHSVGANNSLRFNLFNIWIGCRSCNEFKGGNIQGYDEIILEMYGRERWEYIKFGIKKEYQVMKLMKEELKEKVNMARRIVKEIPLEIRTPEERWQLRKELNKKINIYA